MHHPNSDRLQLYVDQRLGDAERLSLDMHFVACPHCAEQVRTLRQLLTGLESLSELSLPADFAADMAEEVAPSEGMAVAPARRSVLVQAGICLIILLTSGALLTIVDTPVTDPSDDVLGAVDVLLGSPFQADANIVAVLAIMALAGVAVLACVLGSTPRPRPRRRDAVPSRIPRHRR
ncbi:MAG: anti-sigma factor family protein [Chloroflexota bacterium]